MNENRKLWISDGLNLLSKEVFAACVDAGWYTDRETGESIIETRNTPEQIALMHSELSEALEGIRKDKMDDHLPHRKSVEVELADCVIRIADLCGRLGLDLGGAVIEKMAYNATRADHKLENRRLSDGKRF